MNEEFENELNLEEDQIVHLEKQFGRALQRER